MLTRGDISIEQSHPLLFTRFCTKETNLPNGKAKCNDLYCTYLHRYTYNFNEFERIIDIGMDNYIYKSASENCDCEDICVCEPIVDSSVFIQAKEKFSYHTDLFTLFKQHGMFMKGADGEKPDFLSKSKEIVKEHVVVKQEDRGLNCLFGNIVLARLHSLICCNA